MPASVEDIARTLIALDDAYDAHVAVCKDSPCLNCDTLAVACGDAMIALREAVPAASSQSFGSDSVPDQPHGSTVAAIETTDEPLTDEEWTAFAAGAGFDPGGDQGGTQ